MFNNFDELLNNELPNSPLELTTQNVGVSKEISKMVIENEPAKYTYPVQMISPFQREYWTVSTDHCYARPWNWKPESTFLKPAKTLFMLKNLSTKPLFSTLGSPSNGEEEIDIETVTATLTPVYDVEKAKGLMEECEKHANLTRCDSDENWEDKISKINWLPSQHRLYNGFVNILNSYYLAKMAQTGIPNEPILRRTVIDKAVQRVRRLFTTVLLDVKLLQWLHQLMIDNLDQPFLALYLDILQTLKSKIPSFVDKMMCGANASVRMGPLSNENLFPLLKKPWDPVTSSLMQDKPKKLPGNPIIILVPSSPVMSKRTHKWMTLLSHLGHVVTVPTNFGSSGHRLTMTTCLDQMFALTRGRVQETRENHIGKQIILVGVGAGAALAIQVAQVENVLCVVSLGFSLFTAEGRRGEPDDNLLELQCPVLFVIGQCSSTSVQEDVEDLRERMRVETALIVVGSADNNLIVNKKKKKEEGITQSIVDRCIVDEVGEFISGLILSPFPPQIRQSPTTVALEAASKKTRNERKRYNSNASSADSQPPSPKVSRPVGRPSGSKNKSKLEAKWAAHMAQARLQAYSLTKNVAPGGQLSTLLQGGIKTIPPKQASPIRVLENVQLSSQATAKLMGSGVGRPIDITKLTLASSSGGSVVLLPDGKMKTIHARVPQASQKGKAGTPIVLPPIGAGMKRRYVSAKRPSTIKRHTYVPVTAPTVQTALPPPTNLTSQDIMDLPIIFADDAQILDATLPKDLSTTGSVQQQPRKSTLATPTSKFVIVNKPSSAMTNYVVNSPGVKRPTPQVSQLPTKFTKIILSKKAQGDSVQLNPIRIPIHAPQQDIENELVATAVPKPNYTFSEVKGVTSYEEKTEDFAADDDDPDYVPPKNLKIT
ncbi:KAT8 regulatory NSL complex subunit 3 isoform X2 [Cylas formicarius]|uniref:KAT8 regulatory NSL complex subunit 3 isoform X2 n=1 Tax=Cylas formicarius TaxID=197179 RepID=UPI002958CF4B|nr:KAT8 regulatory NSL complex subunit 3 isoform X2 [Cylas formicarius]